MHEVAKFQTMANNFKAVTNYTDYIALLVYQQNWLHVVMCGMSGM